MKTRLITFGILAIIFIFAFLQFYLKDHKENRVNVKSIVRVGVFGALSAILYIFVKFPLPFLPSFLELHFDEVPVLIASFAYGPLSGLCVLLIKTIIKIPFSTTLCVGEITDFLFSVVFILPGAFLYKRKRTFKTVIFSLIIGSILQLGISLLGNIYLMIPFYTKLMGFTEEGLLELCQMVNPKISNIGWSYGLLAVLPFNFIKNLLVIVITIPTYKSTHKFFDKI